MKKIIYFLFMMCLTTVASAQVTFSIEDFKMKPGESYTVSINMKAAQDVKGFQFDIFLPEGFSFTNTGKMTEWGSGMNLTGRVQKSGALRLIVLSLSGDVIEAGEGAVATFDIQSENTVSIGTKTITISEAQYNTAETGKVKFDDVISSFNIYQIYKVNASCSEVQGSVSGSGEVESGSAITLSATAKTGYHFVQWSDGTTEAEYTFTPIGNTDLTAEFAPNSYKVTFVAEGATVKEETLDFGTAITAPEAPAKEGYTFKSWGEVAETVPAKNVTYTAEYTINTYKVTYMVDGVEYKSVDAEYGAALNAIEEPAKEGHTFSGWNGLPANMPATDVNVTGTFAVNQYIITYYVGNDIWATDTYDFGATVTIRIYEPTETRYSFTGWEEESVETMPAHDIEYHTTLADGISNVFENNKPINVYTLSGNKIASNIMSSELSQILSKGIYIVNGKKVIVK